MSESQNTPKWKIPGPIWIWLVAAIAVPQVVKRVFIGWPLPKAEDFNFGSRFVDNLVANSLLGLPIFVVFLIAFYWVNRLSAP